MQKKLLSILLVAQCSFVCSDDRLPVINDKTHAENHAKDDLLRKEIDELEQEVTRKKRERDKVSADLYSYSQTNAFREALVQELTNGSAAVSNYKKSSDDKSAEQTIRHHKNDNGIERGWIYGVTDPIAGSRASKEYERVAKLEENRKEIDSKLSAEMVGYKNEIEKNILSGLNKDVEKKVQVIEVSYLPAFQKCDCFNDEVTYFKCLGKKGINKDQVSESFVEAFANECLEDAYSKITERNIPLTEEEFVIIANEHKLTKEVMVKFMLAKENFKKAIRRELFKAEEKQEEKPSILEASHNIQHKDAPSDSQ